MTFNMQESPRIIFIALQCRDISVRAWTNTIAGTSDRLSLDIDVSHLLLKSPEQKVSKQVVRTYCLRELTFVLLVDLLVVDDFLFDMHFYELSPSDSDSSILSTHCMNIDASASLL